jgi:hypothetical protein
MIFFPTRVDNNNNEKEMACILPFITSSTIVPMPCILDLDTTRKSQLATCSTTNLVEVCCAWWEQTYSGVQLIEKHRKSSSSRKSRPHPWESFIQRLSRQHSIHTNTSGLFIPNITPRQEPYNTPSASL